jgi:hypothetical protein
VRRLKQYAAFNDDGSCYKCVISGINVDDEQRALVNEENFITGIKFKMRFKKKTPTNLIIDNDGERWLRPA